MPVYPRWRGEHHGKLVVTQAHTGLSPLARGTPQQVPPRIAPMRFIPAGAGNTCQARRAGFHNPVYPRWRGEHSGAAGVADFFPRFIPAGAGNTVKGDPRKAAEAVYPRWRGEHFRLRVTQNAQHGLSPLARGTLFIKKYFLRSPRFIPAGAGNTSTIAAPFTAWAVYPRWRGEHGSAQKKQVSMSGLSPLARGTHACRLVEQYFSRFIPAGAGNTSS